LRGRDWTLGSRARSAGASKVQGDISKIAGALDPRLYGQNLEFMGRQFEGGILAEKDSTAPQCGGLLRGDVLAALQDMGIRHLRWPGGCYADVYNWRDGIGSVRSTIKNEMWGDGTFKAAKFFAGQFKTPIGSDVDNRFGTHEFIEYCNRLGAEPSITQASAPRNQMKPRNGWHTSKTTLAKTQSRSGPWATSNGTRWRTTHAS